MDHKHTHNHFTALLDSVWDYPGETAPKRQNQEGKTNLDLLEQDSEWQWHQLGHMQICTLIQTHKHASIPSLILQAGCPSCHPTNSIKAHKCSKCFPSGRTRALSLFLQLLMVASLTFCCRLPDVNKALLQLTDAQNLFLFFQKLHDK